MFDVKLLQYSSSPFQKFMNLGDEIQTLAIKKLVPGAQGYICREELNSETQSAVIPLYGYFMNSQNWPPSDAVRPFFYSFHLAEEAKSQLLSDESIRYFKKWEPIGCRDQGTADALRSKGVDVFVSRCLTLTLKARDTPPKEGKIYTVGLNKAMYSIIPRHIREKVISVEQAKVRLPITRPDIKMQLAEELLSVYRETAELVITSKIHCALPCIAMGIPVVFLYPARKKQDYRVKVVEEFVPIHYVNDTPLLGIFSRILLRSRINWTPKIPDISKLRETIKADFQSRFEEFCARFQ